jgi:hypothetical protein
MSTSVIIFILKYSELFTLLIQIFSFTYTFRNNSIQSQDPIAVAEQSKAWTVFVL